MENLLMIQKQASSYENRSNFSRLINIPNPTTKATRFVSKSNDNVRGLAFYKTLKFDSRLRRASKSNEMRASIA